MVSAQVPQIPSRQSESKAIGCLPARTSRSFTMSSISRKEAAAGMSGASYSASFPEDCASRCRQILSLKFMRGKSEVPNPKSQRSSKLQIPMAPYAVWNLGFGASLELGVWDLEFHQRAHL